jgi:hypothetical protein
MEPKKELIIRSNSDSIWAYGDVLRAAQILGATRPRIMNDISGAWVYSRKVNFKEACTVLDIVTKRKLDVTIYLDGKPVKTFGDVKAIFFGFPLEEVIK